MVDNRLVAQAMADDMKPRERRSVGDLPTLLGEATCVRRQPEELQRKNAQERVFGERRRSAVSPEEFRGVSSTASVEHIGHEQAEALRRAHDERLTEFQRSHVELFSKQTACVVPKGYGGIKLSLPASDEDISALIHSFTRPYALPHARIQQGRNVPATQSCAPCCIAAPHDMPCPASPAASLRSCINDTFWIYSWP